MARRLSGPYVSGRLFNKQQGSPIGGATITVSATVYTDDEMQNATTTVITNGTGDFQFYALPGLYTLTTIARDAAPIEPVEIIGNEGLGVDRSNSSGASSAATTTFTPTGTVAASDVQSAIAEVASEAVQTSTRGAASGVATLDSGARVPGAQLSARALGWYDLKADFGAKGDGKYLTDGAITSGQATLTSASAGFTSADVGKMVWVFGAGASAAALITTISAVPNGTTATLAANASTTVASGAKFLYASDDTTAIQTALNSVNTAGGGTIYAPRGIYGINGAQQTGSVSGTLGGSWTYNYSGQILFPARGTNTSGKTTIRLLGETPASLVYWMASFTNSNTAPILGGATFVSSATTGAVFDAIPDVQGQQLGQPMTDILASFECLSLLLPNNPTAHGVYANVIASLETDRFQVGVLVPAGTLTVPASGSTTAIFCPRNGNSAYVDLRRTQVYGFPRGIDHTEHTHLSGVAVEQCQVAVNISGAGHMSVYDKLLVQECGTVIRNASGSGPTILGNVTVEANGSSTTYKALVDDTTGTLTGDLTALMAVSPNSGHPVGGVPYNLNIKYGAGANSGNGGGFGNVGWMGQYPNDTFRRIANNSASVGLADQTAHPWLISLGAFTTGSNLLQPTGAADNFAWPIYNLRDSGSRVVTTKITTGGASSKSGVMLNYVVPYGLVVCLDVARNLVAIQKRTGTATYTDLALGTAGAPAIATGTQYTLTVVLKQPSDPTASWTVAAYIGTTLAASYTIDATTQGQLTSGTDPWFTRRDGCWTNADTSARFASFRINPLAG